MVEKRWLPPDRRSAGAITGGLKRELGASVVAVDEGLRAASSDKVEWSRNAKPEPRINNTHIELLRTRQLEDRGQ